MENAANQKQVWEKFWQEQHYAELEVKEYHLDIKKVVDNNIQGKCTSIEIGSGIGITSLILADELNCTLLDFDANILEKAAALFAKQGKKASYITCDMFDLSSLTEKYDVVFNSGVVEHYNKHERKRLIEEYKKVMSPNGVMIIAVPNHYCIPYKIGYTLLRLLGRWQYPKEYAIKDIAYELQGTGLMLSSRVIASNTLIENSIGNAFIRKVYVCLKKIFRIQGYLRIFVIHNIK